MGMYNKRVKFGLKNFQPFGKNVRKFYGGFFCLTLYGLLHVAAAYRRGNIYGSSRMALSIARRPLERCSLHSSIETG